MKLFLPKQHGAWAMLIIPFWLGAAEGGIVWQHIPFFLGWLLLYLAVYPMLLIFKGKKVGFYRRWTLAYLLPALIFLMVPLFTEPRILYFGIAMIPFFCINAYYSSKNRDRALLNDLSAIFAFSTAGLASSYLSSASLSGEALLVFAGMILFFGGSTLYVKTMVREKKNVRFKYISWAYHVIVPLTWLIVGEPIIMLAFLPSLFRAILFYGRSLSVMKVGVYEIINAVLFFIMIFIRIM
ncbi:YwiC-like family protein [Mesobacillus zeae]|uniref:YwiC-like family protein n=1 Tax=Mesobacillus zeae TaxID=1917180 RepID=A0A398B541_9BACI|nr:YwiC-like family protein [Mesobacillus zeae]RID84554.1 hypothetical protein D1970_11705 [Mesobacillus zeae]